MLHSPRFWRTSGQRLAAPDVMARRGGDPAAVHLLESVRALKLRVDTNVGGHGGVAPFAKLVKAAGN
ncbi:MAG: hypothetical protein HY701_04630 [Gemmatimonadetes bacterium]|nr:hypothetical protein [Gemmatimonadota bacterium]